MKHIAFSTLLFFISHIVFAQASDTSSSEIYGGLKFRNITPAFVSGRIADFAVNPENPSEYYVGVASGHIWKTSNNGTTFKPIFERYGTYAIGCLKLDPQNSNVIWAGTGENNHQRAIGYGNGIYKSTDSGESWKNMGLKDSRQIGMIAIHPTNSEIVFVAAEGSIWGSSADRGLYKSTDGGDNWRKVLTISNHTGVNNVVLDPFDNQVVYATSEQRRRHVNIRIGGGPESAIYKSTDGGDTFHKIVKGLPKVDIGGIGIAVSPIKKNLVYAIVEAASGKGGFFRSTNGGESWKKMSSHSASGQYYNEIYCDPINPDKVFSVETRSHYTLDGGKTWLRLGLNKRHVDDHALWIDPKNTAHFIIGGDGGIYETYDFGAHYIHKTNLPVTQFYRVNVDNSYPFYWIYGGTQDNSSMGVPSQTLYRDGITRGEWVITQGGDGFWQAIDPTDPNIVYSEYQYGNLFRFDKKSGEKLNIKPRERIGEQLYKWNWNTPFILSPHNHKRLYMVANKVFRSDDRGHSWQVISEDITANIKRDNAPVMDRYWGVDAVAKNVSTSLYGMGVSLEESPLQENLIYVGTDDGLIQVSEDSKHWRKQEHFPGIPAHTYVSDIRCSKHDKNTVFASFDNRKRDDFKPYLLRSKDKGNSWHSIAGDLPQNGTVHSIEQDHVNPNLIFVGTEFGVFFSTNMGKNWVKLKAGIPDVSVKDIVIQQRENDLVMATFGRGFYILDDYSPLREMNPSFTDKEAHLFPIKNALRYLQRNRGGYGFGSMVYKSKNAPFGATFTYYIKEIPKTLRQIRQKKEKGLVKDKLPIPIPNLQDLEKEKNEVAPYLIFAISDKYDLEIIKLNQKFGKGIQRKTWNLQLPYPAVVTAQKNKFNPLQNIATFGLATPGDYKLTIYQVVRGKKTKLIPATPFKITLYKNQTIIASNPTEIIDFQRDIAKLGKALHATQKFSDELETKINHLHQAISSINNCPPVLAVKSLKIKNKIRNLKWKLTGQKPKASPEEVLPATPPINQRYNTLRWIHQNSSAPITQTEQDLLKILKAEFPPILDAFKKIHFEQIPHLEALIESAGGAWTPGRVPVYRE